MERYQDTWIHGRVTEPGVRVCAPRYDAVATALRQYQRPFTALDLGANLGYFTFRVADDFPDAVVVAVEDDPRLPELCFTNSLPNVILLHQRLSVADLQVLATCEHFDVVLALNVLHHFGRDWRDALSALRAMSDHVIVETPTPEDVRACGFDVVPDLYEHVLLGAHHWLTETKSHTGAATRPMVQFDNLVPKLSRAYFNVPSHVELGGIEISSTYISKLVRFLRKNEERPWHAGINLQTYCLLSGAYPSRQALASRVERIILPEQYHGDVEMWNIVIDGKAAYLIDGHDGRGSYAETDEQRLRQLAAQLRSM